MKEPITIVIPEDYPPQCQGSPYLARLKPYGDLKIHETRAHSAEEQIDRARDATILIKSGSFDFWPAEVLRQLPRLKMIAICGIGTDAVDLEEAQARNIIVSNVPGKTAHVIAEHAFALMLAVAKRLAYQTAVLKSGTWAKVEGILLQGKTLGVLGTGNSGAAMARLGNAIDMNVIAWTFHPSPQRAADIGVRYVALDELLRRSDVVSIHLSLTADTHHLMDRRKLATMKPGAILVNVTRGPIVDQTALVDALNSGHLGGAGLDVFEEEPLPADSPLARCEQVVLTPHVADMVPEGVDLLNHEVVDNVIAFLEGHPQNVVT